MRYTLSLKRTQRAERGVTLIIVLILLVVVTVLGIGGARIAMLGERSTRFDRDYQIAWQAAEAALMDAEQDIDPEPSQPSLRGALLKPGRGLFVDGCGSSGNSRGLCNASAGTPIWQTVDFSNVNDTTAQTVAFGAFTGRVFHEPGSGVAPARKPRYIVEIVPDVRPSIPLDGKHWMYRVTAIGYGPSDEVQVMLQAAYKKQE